MLVDAVEKLVARMDEAELASTFERDLYTMPADACGAFVEAMFDAFRERGESSEDAAEGAGTTVAQVERRERPALDALVRYACANAGLLKEATALFVEAHPDFVSALPHALYRAIAERLSLPT